MKRKSLIIIFALFLLPANGITGSYSGKFILEQVKQKKIPKICAYTRVMGPKRNATELRLLAKYGPGWNHMHHYCWALVDLQKGKQKEALGNLDYVLRNTDKNFEPRLLVLSQKGSIFINQKRYQGALAVYREMAEIKPDSEQGWVGMANVFIALKDYDTALEILQNGQKHVQDSLILESMIKKYKNKISQKNE